jgi:hypothetical protein
MVVSFQMLSCSRSSFDLVVLCPIVVVAL